MAAPITREKLASVFGGAQDQDPLRKHLNPLLACGPSVTRPRPSLPSRYHRLAAQHIPADPPQTQTPTRAHTHRTLNTLMIVILTIPYFLPGSFRMPFPRDLPTHTCARPPMQRNLFR